MGAILILNGRVWDGEHFIKADVLINGGKILKVASNIQTNAEFVYDATGKIVSSGLVDIHVHMQGIGPPIFGINAEMSCIPFGVTSAVDACAVSGDKTWLDRSIVKSLVFANTAFINNQASFSNTEKMLETYQDRVIGVKAYFDETSGQVQDISPLCAVIEFAEKHKLKVMVHSSNPPTSMKDLLSVLRRGDILTHSYHGGKNNVAGDNYEALKEAKGRGVIVDVGFAGNVHADFSVLKGGILNGAAPTTISTDITRCSAYKRGGRYGMTMCMSIARISGMSEEEVFQAVTSSAAKAVNKEDAWGYLREGRCADIAILEWADESFDLTDKAGNRIVSKKGYRNILTIIDGEIVYKN